MFLGFYGYLPREFYKLTDQEVAWIIRGKKDFELNELYKVRLIAWASSQAFYFKPVTPEKFMPLAGDAPPITRARAEKILERYQKAGYFKEREKENIVN